jgi:hypothetical protein
VLCLVGVVKVGLLLRPYCILHPRPFIPSSSSAPVPINIQSATLIQTILHPNHQAPKTGMIKRSLNKSKGNQRKKAKAENITTKKKEQKK